MDHCVTVAGQGIFLSMMAPHLVDVLDANHEEIALVFSSWGVIYIIGAPLAGFVSGIKLFIY